MLYVCPAHPARLHGCCPDRHRAGAVYRRQVDTVVTATSATGSARFVHTSRTRSATRHARQIAGSMRCSQRRCEVGHNWCRRSRTDDVAGKDAV